jgi:hypothetical protein
MHEVAYLLILSRAGKMLDLKGFHKLHAFAVSYEDVALICMMPSKGGKSTLLAELLKDSRIKMISDDIPLIDTFGNVYPFPLKLGLDSIPLEMQIFEREKNTYSMKRNYYGVKELICTRGLPGKVEPMTSKFKKVILVEAFRYNSPTSILAKSSFLKTFKGLLKHGVIGIGSPIVIEYFWETGFIDFLKKTGIFFLRILAFTSLSVRSKKMQLFLGKNSKNTSQEILNILSGYSQL